MKTIIKIVIALLLVTAAVNAGRAAFTNYQFEDAVHEGLLFDPQADDKTLTEMIMKLAGDYDIPLDAGDIAIHMVGQDLTVDMSYTASVVLVPGVYATDWTFTPSTSTRILGKSNRLR